MTEGGTEEAASPRQLAAATLLEGPAYTLSAGRILTIADGAVAEVSEGVSSPAGAGSLVMPALVNAHDHARAVPSSAYGVHARPLEIWLQALNLLPPVDPYLAACVSLGRSALGGCAAVMVHFTRPLGNEGLVEQAVAVARAARDIGLRVAFAVALKDRNPLTYGPHHDLLARLPEPVRGEIAARLPGAPSEPAEQIALVEAVAEALAGFDVDVQYGPTGPQWCSDALLAAIAEASARTGRRIHMHMLETPYQRAWADRAHPEGLVDHLDAIGLLSPRMTLAHCTHARPSELDRLAERDVTIAVNAGSNLGLRSGIAPVAEMVRRGCRVAMGLDGLALLAEEDALGEMRLTHALHGGLGFREDVSAARILRLALRDGRRAVTGEERGGVIAPGEPADLLVIDRATLDPYRLPGGTDLDLLLSRGRTEHIAEVIVAGRTVAREGRLTRIDHAAMQVEMLEVLRSGMARDDMLRRSLEVLALALAEHYGAPACC